MARTSSLTSQKTNKAREKLAEMFVASLKEEALPWHQPWMDETVRYGQAKNVVSDKRYRGVNALLLWIVSQERGYSDPRWCTYKQASEKGWQVKKGEHGCPVEYWYVWDKAQKKSLTFSQRDQIVRADPAREPDMLIRCNTYTVFNGQQIEGIPALERAAHIPPEYSNELLARWSEAYLQNAGITFTEGDRAAYSPSRDTLVMPRKESFGTELAYYGTLFHECAHSTGHESRLNREMNTRDNTSYAIEELRAEMAGAFLLSAAGVEVPREITENNKAYVQTWASRIEDNSSVLFAAIKDANDISDYVEEVGELDRFKAVFVEIGLDTPEPNEQRMAQIREAFEAAGLSYDSLDSRDGQIVIADNSSWSRYFFDSWEEVADWLDNVVFDDPARGAAAARVLHPDRFEKPATTQTQAPVQSVQYGKDKAYVYLPTTNEIGIVVKGEAGYYRTDIGAMLTPDESRALVDEQNERLGLSKAEAMALQVGSMFGWDVPGADPSAYDENGAPKRDGTDVPDRPEYLDGLELDIDDEDDLSL